MISCSTHINGTALTDVVSASRNTTRLNRITLVSGGAPVHRDNILFCSALCSRGTDYRLTLNINFPRYLRNKCSVSGRRLLRRNIGISDTRISFVVNASSVSVTNVAPSKHRIIVFRGNR